jgi:hypothetical protein
MQAYYREKAKYLPYNTRRISKRGLYRTEFGGKYVVNQLEDDFESGKD